MEALTLTKAEQNKQVALTSVEALGRHDVDAVFEHCTPDFMDYGNGSGNPIPVEPGKQFFKGFVNAFPDYTAGNPVCVADDEWAMVWCDCSGTWKNEFLNQKPNGKSFKFNDVDIFRFNEDGKIVEHHNMVDLKDVFKKIDLVM